MEKAEMKTAELVEMLTKFGLTLYEAKAYISLLYIGSGSGYAVAKHAGISTAKIYETLASLVLKGFAVNSGMRKASYQAIKPHQILSTMKADMNSQMDALENSLGKIASRDVSISASMISGTEKIDAHIRELITATQQTLLVTAWPEDLDRFDRELVNCAKKNKVFLLSYGEFDLPLAEVIRHRRADLVKQEMPGRMLLAVSDWRCGGIASYSDINESSQGFFFDDESFAKILADHFIHDVSINKLMEMLPPEYAADSENCLTELRNRISSFRKL